jgi:hypothetical protein
LEALVSDTKYTTAELHICKLHGGSEVDMLFYINRDIDPVRDAHQRVMDLSVGFESDIVSIFRVGTFSARNDGYGELPESGVVLKVRLERNTDLTHAVTDMGRHWAEVFGVKLWATYISRWLNDDAPMSVEELIMVDSPAGFIPMFEGEHMRSLTVVS